MMPAARWLLLALLGLVLCAQGAGAHDSRPLNIELRELSPGAWRLSWSAPPSLPGSDAPALRLGEGCTRTEASGPGGPVGQAFLQCAEGIDGQTLTIAYPAANPSLSTLIRLHRLSGETQSALLGPAERVWTVPAAESAAGVARSYTWLGIRHIWEGFDHLLFLACLLWIAGTWSRMLVTVLGFTLAHSVSLCLSALGWIWVPTPPLEAAIALSIVFLASELLRDRRTSLTWRHPVAVSSVFGLLHGLGFATVLADVGLPQTQLLTGLLFFNVGVEMGQLAFIALLWASRLPAASASRSRPALVGRLRTASAYGIGILASVWVIERVSAMLA